MLGLLKKSGGTVTLFGKDAWQDSLAIHESIAYVPGDLALWENLTGGQTIDLLMKLHGKGNQAKKEELVRKFQLDLSKKVKSYSKGNRQKVGLIAALAVDCELYILDEPTSGLDPLMESVFQDEVARLKAEQKAVLLSSHILSEVERFGRSSGHHSRRACRRKWDFRAIAPFNTQYGSFSLKRKYRSVSKFKLYS